MSESLTWDEIAAEKYPDLSCTPKEISYITRPAFSNSARRRTISRSASFL